MSGIDAFSNARDLIGDLRAGRTTSRELLEHFLDRVERFNPVLNAVVTLDARRARETAERIDRARARGRDVGPLQGLPMTVKDSLETAGLRTTAGAEVYARHVPETNAVAVQRLVDAGAVIFGKTNTPAFAADLQTYNPVYGTTANPWDTERSPGGSSGGSATALAAGLTPLELGSDIAGSIRGPAHFCGVYGHKPSYGIVPQRGHIPGPPGTLAESDLSVIGPLARSAGDLADTLGLLVGPIEPESRAWRLELPKARRNDLRRFRVAVWLEDPALPVDSDVAEPLHQAVDQLAAAGARIDEHARPDFPLTDALRDYLSLLYPVTSAGLPQHVFDRLAAQAEQVREDDDSFSARLARYSTQSHRDWLAANEARHRYRARFQDFFRDFDVLICPVEPVTAIVHDQSRDTLAREIIVDGKPRSYWEQFGWISLATLAGLPAVSVPVGSSAQGLPVGAQVIGPFLEDYTPLAFAAAMSEALGGFRQPPDYA